MAPPLVFFFFNSPHISQQQPLPETPHSLEKSSGWRGRSACGLGARVSEGKVNQRGKGGVCRKGEGSSLNFTVANKEAGGACRVLKLRSLCQSFCSFTFAQWQNIRWRIPGARTICSSLAHGSLSLGAMCLS